MIVAGCQLDCAWEDKATSFGRVNRLLAQAQLASETLLVLPEMFATGFSLNTAVTQDGAGESAARFLARTAQERQLSVLGGVTTVDAAGHGRNEAVAYDSQGTELVRYQKMRPFSPAGELGPITPGTEPKVFQWQGITVAPFICYDLRFPEIFRQVTAKYRPELFVIIASWPSPRIHHWVKLLQARAIENQAYVIGVNRTGNDPKLNYNGRSLIVDHNGEIAADAGEAEGIITAELNIAALRKFRTDLPFLNDLR